MAAEIARQAGRRPTPHRRLARFVETHSGLLDLAAACAAGVLLGAGMLALSPLWVLIGLVGGVGVLIALRRPEIALLGILFMTSSIFDQDFTSLPSIKSLRIVDFVYVALLGLIALRWLAEREFRLIVTPLDAPLLAFWGTAMLSTLFAILRSTVAQWAAFDEMRTISYYLTFFVVTNLVRDRRQTRTLVRGFFLLAAGVAVAMLAQFALGKSAIFLAGRVETLKTQYTVYREITRILPPGQSVLLVAFLALTAIMVLDRPATAHPVRLIAWGLTGAAVLLTFNRSFWFSVALGLGLLAILLTGEDRRQYIRWSLAIGIALVASAAVMVAVAPETRVSRLITASVYRFVTLADVSAYGEDRSFRDRFPEYEYVIPQVVSQPVLGAGMGANYRPYDSRLDWEGHDARRYIHNAHLWLLMKSGLVGYGCLVWLLGAFLARAFKHWPRISDPELRGAVLSFAITTVGVLIAAIVNPILMQSFWTPVIGLMMGLSEQAIRDQAVSPST